MGIIIKSSKEIAIMREAGRIVAAILETLRGRIRSGMKTRELDAMTARELGKYGARSAFKDYRGFPAHLCISVNDEIVHGIPGEREFLAGDIVSLDVGVIRHGFHGDAALTVGVEEITPLAERLLATTKGALAAGISVARHGAHLGDISAAIEFYVESRGFSVVREYTGHGIGRELHEEPLVPNFGQPGQGPVLQRGMTFALEPMVNTGGCRTKLDRNQWTVLTADGSLSAHFEHTLAITDSGAEVLTML